MFSIALLALGSAKLQKKPIPPDQRPEFAFVRTLRLEKPNYTELQRVTRSQGKGTDSTSYPCWYYDTNATPHKVARLLKAALTTKDGWTWTAPDQHYPIYLHAVHKVSGHEDWHVSTDCGWTLTVRGSTSIMIWDKSTVLHREHCDEGPFGELPFDKTEAAMWERYGFIMHGVRPESIPDLAHDLSFKYLLPPLLAGSYRLDRVAVYPLDPKAPNKDIRLAAGYTSASGAHVVLLEAKPLSTAGSQEDRDQEAEKVIVFSNFDGTLFNDGNVFNTVGLQKTDAVILTKPTSEPLMDKIEAELHRLDKQP